MNATWYFASIIDALLKTVVIPRLNLKIMLNLITLRHIFPFLKLLKNIFALAAILISLKNKEVEKELVEQRLRTTAWVEHLQLS